MGQGSLGIGRVIIGFIGILTQFIHMESPHVGMGIFTPVIPTHQKHPRLGRTSHQCYGLRHDIQILRLITGYANLGFNPKQNIGRLSHISLSARKETPSRLCRSQTATGSR